MKVSLVSYITNEIKHYIKLVKAMDSSTTIQYNKLMQSEIQC